MLSHQTDTEVFQALCAGNLLGLGILYERYGEIVYRLALRMLNNPQEAEDLTQEVFLTLWRNRSYDSKRGSMLAFLTILTRSKGLDRHRQLQAQRRMQERWGQNNALKQGSDVMDKLAIQEISRQVQEALAKLPSHQRCVLEKAYFDGLSQSEIAKDLDLPLGTVKTHKRNALLKLRQMLQNLV